MSAAPLHTDHQLFEQISDGDEKAFTLLFHRYMPLLFPFVSKLIKDASLAENVVQETFLKLWLSRYKLSEVENPAAWIHRIAINECYRMLRRQLRPSPSKTADNSIDPLNEAIQLREVVGLIQEAVATLPEQRRTIYILSREGGMTIPQIANHLQISPNTVKNTLVTALKTIRTFLEARGYALPTVLLLWIWR